MRKAEEQRRTKPKSTIAITDIETVELQHITKTRLFIYIENFTTQK